MSAAAASCSGSTRTRQRSGPVSRRPRPSEAAAARVQHGRGRGRALPGGDRRGRARVRGREAAARLLRAARARPAGRRSSGRAAIARDHGLLVIADGKRGDVPVTAAAYAQALVGETPGPYGAVPRPRRGRLHRQPAARPRRARAADRGGGGSRRRLLRARPHLEPRRGRAPGRAASRRCTSGSRGWSTSSASTSSATAGSRSWARSPAPREPGLLARLRELMPRAVFLLPGVGAQGGRVGGPRAGLRAAPARPGSSPPRARS